MSDHPEVPRVEFDEDGESMNIEQAVKRFRELLELSPGWERNVVLKVAIRPCDCDSDIRGRDSFCALHGDEGPDGYGSDDAVHPLPEWCSTGECGDPRCHRDRPRAGCTTHRKCRDRYDA
jgi:hypothetical protein